MLKSNRSHGRGVERRVPEIDAHYVVSTAHRPDLCEQSVTILRRSTAEQQSARADDRRVLALAPQVEPASFINKLFRFFSFPAVIVKCSL